jgi:NTE family protein
MAQPDELQGALSDAHRDMLIEGLRRIFGEFNEDMLRRVLPRVVWVELAGGERLIEQGQVDESLYFVISGRLRAIRSEADASQRTLGDISRGETVGEIAFFTGEPRSATVVALRDSVLAKFTAEVFRELLIAYPLVSMNMTRLIIDRLKRVTMHSAAQVKPVVLGLAAIDDAVDLQGFAERLRTELAAFGSTEVVTSGRIGQWLGDAEAAQAPMHDTQRSRELSRKLEEIESTHAFVLLAADRSASGWTQRCLRHCDEVLLVAHADAAPGVHPIEAQCLPADAGLQANRTLILLHPAGRRSPTDTARWLAPRKVATHVHLRPDTQRDWQRLARQISREAVGLVLSGGGARGFAHLGILRALEEAGHHFDLVGGTSIGSVMGAYAAMDLPAAEVTALAREAFRANPTGDFNLVPMISLIGGQRLKRIIDGAIVKATGADIGIEDLWKGFYCVSSNYSTASEAVLTRGPLAKSVRASVSIPGALPPVMLDGELHIDGGTFNNFPTDVMQRQGVSHIIGVNLLRERSVRYALEEVPAPGHLLRDKLMGRRNRLPGITALLLNASMMYSYARQQESRDQVDLYFAPDVHRYGMLDWASFDRIVQVGYEHAMQVLEQQARAA